MESSGWPSAALLLTTRDSTTRRTRLGTFGPRPARGRLQGLPHAFEAAFSPLNPADEPRPAVGSRRAARGSRAAPPARSRQGLRLGRGVPARAADRSRRWCLVAPRRDRPCCRCSTRGGGDLDLVGGGADRGCGLADRDRDLMGRRQVRHRGEPHPAARRGVRLRSPGADQLPRPVPRPGSRRHSRMSARSPGPIGVRGRPRRAARSRSLPTYGGPGRSASRG